MRWNLRLSISDKNILNKHFQINVISLGGWVIVMVITNTGLAAKGPLVHACKMQNSRQGPKNNQQGLEILYSKIAYVVVKTPTQPNLKLG